MYIRSQNFIIFPAGKERATCLSLEDVWGYTGEGELPLTKKTLTCEEVLKYFTGGEYLPVTGLHKQIEVTFSSDVKHPVISTCSLTAIYPANLRYRNKKGIASYPLRGGGRNSGQISRVTFSSFVFNSPGYMAV